MFRPSKKSTPESNHQEDVEEGSDDSKNNSKHDKQQRQKSAAHKKQFISTRLLLGTPILVFLVLFLTGASKGRTVLLTIISIPVTLAACVAAGLWNAQSHQRLIALSFVGSILGNQFPPFVASGLAAAALCLFSLNTRPMLDTLPKEAAAVRHAGQMRAVQATILCVAVLLVENFFVWVVSATYYDSHDGSPKPLQDNGRLIQKYVLESLLEMTRRQVQQLRATVNVQWALVAAVATTLAGSDVHIFKGRTLWGLATHAMLTLACVRFIRTISFLITVLPSQMPSCYRHHFPNPPPQDWVEWIKVGLLPAAAGGCNDLIISGHATVTSVMACVSTSAAGHVAFSTALWTLLAMDFMVEVYEGFHYSVDMWMGVLLTTMLWRILAPVENDDKNVGYTQEFHSTMTMSDVMTYGIPSFVAYVALVVMPQSTANYWIVLYMAIAVVQIVRHGVNHFSQHVLFCTLYLALGIYL